MLPSPTDFNKYSLKGIQMTCVSSSEIKFWGWSGEGSVWKGTKQTTSPILYQWYVRFWIQ